MLGDAIYNALDIENIQPRSKSVYLSLVIRANSDGVCYPTYERISKDTLLSESSVARSIKELVGANLISCTKKYDHNGKSHHTYKVLPVTLTTSQADCQSHRQNLPVRLTESTRQPDDLTLNNLNKNLKGTKPDELTSDQKKSVREALRNYVNIGDSPGAHSPLWIQQALQSANEIACEFGLSEATAVAKTIYEDRVRANVKKPKLFTNQLRDELARRGVAKPKTTSDIHPKLEPIAHLSLNELTYVLWNDIDPKICRNTSKCETLEEFEFWCIDNQMTSKNLLNIFNDALKENA